MTILELVKTFLGPNDTSTVALINAYISAATSEFEEFTHVEAADKDNDVIAQMTIFRLNQRGGEGAKSESFDRIRYEYMDEYPNTIMRQLRARRKIRTI